MRTLSSSHFSIRANPWCDYRVGIGFFGVTSVDQVDALLNTVKYAPMKFDLESI